jgi:HlyD family secretion protein
MLMSSPSPRPALAALLLLVLAAGCPSTGTSNGTSMGTSTRDSNGVVPNYRVVPIERGTLQVSVEATGTLQAATQVELGSRVSGQLLKVLVDYNDPVKQGQLLAEIDPTPFRARHSQAKASVSSAKAELGRVEADLVVKEQTLARAKDLQARQLNSTAELQAAEGAVAIAKAQLEVGRAQLEGAQAGLASAAADLEATRITSPIDGVVLARAVEAGQTVAASLQSPRLFVIARALDELEVVAKVDESDLAIVKAGASGSVAVDAFPGKKFPATVRQIRIDAVNESGVVTFPVVLAVENPEGLLLPGMTATVHIDGPPIEDALIAPAAALRFAPSTSGKKATGGTVWVIDNVRPAPGAPTDAASSPPGGDNGRGKKGGNSGNSGNGAGSVVMGEPRAIAVTVVARAGARVQLEGEGLEGASVIVEETTKSGTMRRPPRVF